MVTRETLIRRALDELNILDRADVAADRLSRYAELLTEVAIPRGLLGPGERERILERHVLEGVALLSLLPEAGPVVDVGSGAGLPGLAIACAFPEAVVCVESEGRRADFLIRVVSELELNVSVVRARAEDAARDPSLRDAAAAATARALAEPPTALELALPFVRPGGWLLVPVGPSARDRMPEITRASKTLAGSAPELVTLQTPGTGADRLVLRVTKEGPTPARYPRRAGVPMKRPLGRV